MEFSRPEYQSGQPFPSPGDLPNTEIEPRSPTLQADSLPAEPQGKPKNTGVGGLSFLQWIFLTQELNWDLLYCRQILYQLRLSGKPSETLQGHKNLNTMGFLILTYIYIYVDKLDGHQKSLEYFLKLQNNLISFRITKYMFYLSDTNYLQANKQFI